MTFDDVTPSPIRGPQVQSSQKSPDQNNNDSTKKDQEIPIITVDSDEEVIVEGDKEWPVQLDGLNVEQILDLSTEPENGGHSDSNDEPETEPEDNGWVRARSPYRGPTPDLDTPPLKSPPDMWGNPGCDCANNFRLGYCYCPDPMSPTTTWVSEGCTDFTASQLASDDTTNSTNNNAATSDDESDAGEPKSIPGDTVPGKWEE